MSRELAQRTTGGGGAGRLRVRCGALVQLLVFTLGLFSTAAGLHGCPRHHHARAGAASGAASAGHTAAGVQARDSSTPGRPFETTTCSCIGACQSGAPLALRPGSAALAVDPATGPAAGLPGHDRASPSPRPDYFLPFPLGPPTA